MFDVIRFCDGTVRISSNNEIGGDWKIQKATLISFSELLDAESYLMKIRDYLILRTEDGKLFVAKTSNREKYSNCAIVIGLTTYTNAKATLEKMNKGVVKT